MTENELKAAFEEHKDAVYRFAWRMMNSASAAEDVAQDVFLSLLRQPERFDPARGRLRPFLLAITRNLVLKRWRDKYRWEELNDEHFVAMPVAIAENDVAEIVGEAVRMLPPLQREVLILAEYEELALDEIARAVESEIGTVKSRLHRARENLRRILAPLKPTNGAKRKRDSAQPQESESSHGTLR